MATSDSDDKLPAGMDEQDLLAILKEERVRAIGFDNDGELKTEREKALKYLKGEMDDMPSLANRSSATTTDAADAVRTLLPEILDIFTGGDDVATFIPTGPDDEEGAKQETDYLKNVIFQQNDGFHTIYTMCQDALQSKIGVATYYWEDYEPEEEVLEGKSEEEALAVYQQANPEPPPAQPAQPGQPPQPAPAPPFEILKIEPGDEEGTYDITIKKPTTGKICIKPIPPEDFAVAQDTVRLPDATYCAMRTRPRVQQLIADGHDEALIKTLPSYGTPTDDADQRARDTAGEHINGSVDVADSEHRQVEVIQHYVRIRNGKTLEIWKVLTGAGEQKLISKEKVERIQFAGITPYVVTHRFYGESVVDLLMSHQRQATAVMRAWLDGIYFMLNQRMEVADSGSNENTIADLLNNTPGYPVRTKTGTALRPVSAAMPNVDLLGAMEYLKTVAEQKTGIVRAAQGLNPDTLHDTKGGMLALMSAAQRRTRLIARVFAETGFKDLFLGVHGLIREHSTRAEQVRFGGEWVSVDPSTWGERADMAIEIGLGSGGKDQAIAMMLQQMEATTKVVEAQGGMQGPVVKAENIANLLRKFYEVTGSKQPEQFVSDPTKEPPQPPAPDPKMLEAQAKAQEGQQQLQIQHAKNQGDLQLAQAKAQSDAQLAQAQAVNDAQLAQQRMEWEADLKERTTTAELNMKWQIAQAELAQQRELNQQKADLQREHNSNMADVASQKIEAQVRVGGEPG